MMQFKCNECGTEFQTNQLVGTLPPQVPLNAYCSEKCLDDNVAKNKPEPNA